MKFGCSRNPFQDLRVQIIRWWTEMAKENHFRDCFWLFQSLTTMLKKTFREFLGVRLTKRTVSKTSFFEERNEDLWRERTQLFKKGCLKSFYRMTDLVRYLKNCTRSSAFPHFEKYSLWNCFDILQRSFIKKESSKWDSKTAKMFLNTLRMLSFRNVCSCAAWSGNSARYGDGNLIRAVKPDTKADRNDNGNSTLVTAQNGNGPYRS